MKLDFAPVDWITLLSIVLAIAALYVLRRRQRHPLLFWWRAVLVLLLLVLLLQPASLRLAGVSRPLVAVACDVSPSMSIAGRLPVMRQFLQQWHGDMEKLWDVRLYRFTRNAAIADGKDTAVTMVTNPTDIQRSLWEIKREAGDALAGIVVLSDCNHNATTLAPRWIAELNVPVFPVTAGSKRSVKDVAVESLQVSDFAFKNVPLDIVAGIRTQGVRGAEVTVTLTDAGSGAVLASRQVTCGEDGQTGRVTLRFTPNRSGRFRYVVEARPLDGEISTANNRRECALEVMRDKLRILYLCGQPGPEYAFLRHALKSDPLVELVSFVILRNPENIALVPENDLALIPFPVHNLFTRDLNDFDALILENFTYQRFGFLPEYLANIRSWVTDKGGGLVMIGGSNAFGAGGWGGTPVEEVLPVTLDRPQDRYENGLFRPVVDDDSHFITTVSDDRLRNGQMWKNAPELDGCQALRPRPGALVLMHHPWNNAVVLAAWEKGKGRVAAVGTNTTWRWALASATPELYNRFWKNVMRYLTKSAEAKGLCFAFDGADYAAGQDFRLRVRCMEKNAGAQLRVNVIEPSGRKTPLAAVRDGEKEWVAQGAFNEPGSYSFDVALERNGITLTRETGTVRVAPALYGEETVLGINEALANGIAADSGGLCFTEKSFSPGAVNQRLKKQAVRDTQAKAPLWTSPWLFALCIAGLAGEWILRRRLGYR